MDFKKIASVLGAVAPTAATAVLGPAGGAVISSIEKVFGFNPNTATADDIATAITGATPDQQLKLKELELNYRLEMSKAEYSDTASARTMAIQTKDNTPRVLTYLIMGAFIGVTIYVRFVTDAHQLDLMKDVVSTARDAVIMVVSFYFGAMHRDNK